MIRISSWGRLSSDPHKVIKLHDVTQIKNCFNGCDQPGVAHGMGRSYGDACLNPFGILWDTKGLDRFISFNHATGILRCEAGVLLEEIQKLFIPRGWMLPVTPGTQKITVGGAIANDVHGKNHHQLGSFGDHVKYIHLIRTNGEQLECSPTSQEDWFAATIGGLGLTGIITIAEIQLYPVDGPWLTTETIPYANIQEFTQLADSSESDWEHTVSWIDCISKHRGRGLFMRGNLINVPAKLEPIHHKKIIPFVPPYSLINSVSLRPFNFAYYTLKKRQTGNCITHYKDFLYPLDNLLEWNRIYGPRGFFQYQSVIPRALGNDATQAMLKEISRSGDGSFLAVMKTFGNRQSVGMLSFPQPGITLALDFPNKYDRTHKLFKRLDAIVREAHGRLYLAKDARMPRDLFEAGYPRLHEFLKYRDPGISSGLSRRLIGS